MALECGFMKKACAYEHICFSLHVHIYICSRMHMYAHMHGHMYACAYTLMYAFVCIDMHMHAYMYVKILMYEYIDKSCAINCKVCVQRHEHMGHAHM